MISFDKLSNEDFQLVHLTEDISLKNFSVKKEGYGLELYLKKYALSDEKEGMARTYLVMLPHTDTIVAYFTLRTGLITVSRGFRRGFDAYTGIELANFAVNDSYRAVNDVIPKLGVCIFSDFVLPLVEEISKYVGAAYLFIYSLPNDKLMNHYKTMGFRCAPSDISKFIYSHVKPAYDKDCVFMYQKI